MEMSFGKLIVLIAFVGSIISYCVTSFINVNPTSSKFLLLELLRQSSLVYALVQMIGLAYYFQVKFFPKNPTFAVLPLVCMISFIMTVTMGYAQTSSCDKPKRDKIMTQALKPVVLLIITYYCVTKIPAIRGGFYDLVSNGNHSEIGMWTAIGFWMAGSIWMSVTSAYFIIEQNACRNDTEINIKELPEQEPVKEVI